MINIFTSMGRREPDMVATGVVFTINGNDNNLNILAVPFQGLYAPSCWYDNGRTYFAHRKSHVGGIDGRAGIVQYYQGEVTNQFMPNGPSSLDYHDNPVITTDGAGKIYLFHEQHDLDKSDIWVNTTPYDITTFEYQQLSPLIGDYPKLFKINNTSFFTIGRRGLPNLRITPYDGVNFGTPVQATAAAIEGANYRHYAHGMLNGFTTQDGWFHLRFMKRVFIEESHYKKFYHVKISPDDIYRWYNIDETYSRKVDTEGHLTETLLDAHYKFADNETSGVGPGGAGIVNGRIVKQINVIENQLRMYTYQNGWSYNTNSDISEKVRAIMKSGNKYYSVGIDGSDLNLYETNLNNIFKFKQKLITSSTGLSAQVSVPFNFDEIPKGGKFALFASGFKNGNTNVANGAEQNDLHIIEMIK